MGKEQGLYMMTYLWRTQENYIRLVGGLEVVPIINNSILITIGQAAEFFRRCKNLLDIALDLNMTLSIPNLIPM